MKKKIAKLIYIPSACIIAFLLILKIVEKNFKPAIIIGFLLIFGTMGFLKIIQKERVE